MNNLEKIEKFFNYNLKIKYILYSTVFKVEDVCNNTNDFIVEYIEKLHNALEEIEYYLQYIMNMYEYAPFEKNYIKELFDIYKKKLLNCGTNHNKLRQFYNDCFSNMREELVNEVGKKNFASSLFSVSVTKAKTINEVLHVLHTTIVNRYRNYEDIPKLGVKKNYINCDITLYGRENQLAQSIFENFPYDLYTGYVDILSLKNNILIMVRDVGHALSIEISMNEDQCMVNYYIPKICNVEMVNSLQGITKVPDDASYLDYAVGLFKCEVDKLPSEIISFISKVPNDNDIEKKLK